MLKKLLMTIRFIFFNKDEVSSHQNLEEELMDKFNEDIGFTKEK